MHLRGIHLACPSKHRSRNVKGKWIMVVTDLVFTQRCHDTSHPTANLNLKELACLQDLKSQVEFCFYCNVNGHMDILLMASQVYIKKPSNPFISRSICG
jgi:hypothetical protein